MIILNVGNNENKNKVRGEKFGSFEINENKSLCGNKVGFMDSENKRYVKKRLISWLVKIKVYVKIMLVSWIVKIKVYLKFNMK